MNKNQIDEIRARCEACADAMEDQTFDMTGFGMAYGRDVNGLLAALERANVTLFMVARNNILDAAQRLGKSEQGTHAMAWRSWRA